MGQYKEIVTKAVIGKGKKTFNNKYELEVNDKVDTVLGCWVINHNMTGENDNGSILIKGNFDVNIWYSYDNNTKTNVAIKNVNYEEKVNVKLRKENILTKDSEIIIRSLRNPNCIDVSSKDNIISYEIEKELGIEIIGDTKVRIMTNDLVDDYDIIEEIPTDEEINKQIDNNVKENFLKDK